MSRFITHVAIAIVCFRCLALLLLREFKQGGITLIQVLLPWPFAGCHCSRRRLQLGCCSQTLQSDDGSILLCGPLQQSFPSPLQVAMAFQRVLECSRHGQSPVG